MRHMRERCSGVLRASFVLAPSNLGFDPVRGELFLLCKNESRADDQNRQNSAAQQSTKAEGRDLCDSCGGQGRFLFFCFFFSRVLQEMVTNIMCEMCFVFWIDPWCTCAPFFFFFFARRRGRPERLQFSGDRLMGGEPLRSWLELNRRCRELDTSALQARAM